MTLKERLFKKSTLTILQRQLMVIVAVLSTLLLINIWPRFLSDAMGLSWQIYAVLIIICLILIPLADKK